MRGTAVVANENAATSDERDQLAQIEPVEKDEVASALAADFGGNLGFAAPEIENGLDSMLVAQFPRKDSKFVDGPTLGEIFRPGMQHGVGPSSRDAVRAQLFRDSDLRIGLRIDAGRRNGAARQTCRVKLFHAMLDGMYAVTGIGNEHVVDK